MTLRSLLLGMVIVALPVSGSARQPLARSPDAAAVAELDRVSGRMNAYLKAVPTFRVESTTQWKLDGVRTRNGNARSTLLVRHPGEFRLEVLPGAPNEPTFQCASDGQFITRLYQRGPIAIFSRTPGSLERLLEDALTDSSLKGSGLDVVTRTDAHQYLLASVSDVKYLGKQDVRGRVAHQFSSAWFGGSRVEFWIAADREPCLLRWVRSLSLDIAGKKHDLRIESDLAWVVDAEFPDQTTELSLPASAVEVKDLQAYLLRGGTLSLLGRPAPEARLKQLDGSEWSLAAQRGNQIVVLYFFATWAAPSTEQKQALLEIVGGYKDRGVVFQAVNVGEAPEVVRSFMEARKYTHSVSLDHEQRTAGAYRVTSLPATVIVAKDGTIQAAHVGLTPEVRTLIGKDLEQLFAGQSLVPAIK